MSQHHSRGSNPPRPDPRHEARQEEGDGVARHRPVGKPQPRRTCKTLVKALARAFRWKHLLGWGNFATIAELAERVGVAPSYITRVLPLVLLAPDFAETILAGRQEPKAAPSRVLKPFPLVWDEQPPKLYRQT